MPTCVAVPVEFADLPEDDDLKTWMSEALDQLGEFAAREMTLTGGRPTIWIAEDGRCWFHISIEDPATLDAPNPLSAARSVVASLLLDQGYDHSTASIVVEDIRVLHDPET